MSATEIVTRTDGTSYEVTDFNNDITGARLGMWFFLFTELMLFGGMFITYAVYFYDFTDDFIKSSEHMNLWLGGLNTVVLLVSAFTIGLSVLFLKAGNLKMSKGLLKTTIILSLIFLTVKYFEWSGEFANGIWPGSPTLVAMSHGANMYFGLYFTLTGLHALHIILGISAMIWVHCKIENGTISQKKFIVFENLALYWDYVHLVWVFVVPLFYIIGYAQIGGTH